MEQQQNNNYSQRPSYGKKFCKYCRTEIDERAKICHTCHKKQPSKVKWIVIGAVVFLFLCAMCSSGNNSNNTTTTDSDTNNSVTQSESKNVTYTTVPVGDMMATLKDNALKAENLYQNQYLEITGRLEVIDSNGQYISLHDPNDSYAIVGVHCNIKNNEQRNKIMNMSKGDIVTLRGKIVSVGEIMGYSLDIDSID